MNQIKLLNSIKDYLTRFQLLVKISNADSEYDINHHAESIIIPILNIVFAGSFKNLNYSERKNFESLDLLEETQKIGIQVTSTSNIEKIKNTLTKFLKYGYERKIDRVLVYILSEKQRSYSQNSIDKIIKKKISFNVRTDIIDVKDIYQRIKALNNIDQLIRINHILEQQFSEIYIANNFTYADFQEFKEEYKERCLTNFSRLNFFGLAVSRKPREVELYSLFVPPLFKTTDPLSYEDYVDKVSFETKSISSFKFESSMKFDTKFLTELLHLDSLNTSTFMKPITNLWGGQLEYAFEKLYEIPKNIVILGNPGAGKSSMIKYSICKILENDESVFTEQAVYDRLPIRLELHRYNKSKVGKQLGVVDFLVETLANEYQLAISHEKVSRILSFFPTLVFFDGLDEIFDVQERLNVRNDIENFAKTYTGARIVVTSRFESYEEVSLSNIFHKVEIQNFNREQLGSYVEKWYALEEADAATRKKEIKHCLEQLESVDPELKFNPLLLSLILILYRNDLELPTNRLSIYEGCTNTIVETRDTKEKKLGINLKINSKISVFSALAFWQFDNPNKTFNNKLVQTFVKDYLMRINEFQDDFKAGQAAEEFLDFAKIRSVYFENKFTHKTFLEYFTAYYIFSTHFVTATNRKKFNDLLDRNLGLSSWAVVLDLLICKIDAAILEGSVIQGIICRQLEKNPNDALLFFLQIVRYLTHINDTMIVDLFERALKACFQSDFELKESKINHAEVLFGHLLTLFSNERFKDAVTQGFRNQLSDAEISDENLTIFAYEFSILTQHYVFVDMLIAAKRLVVTPYVFLLQHYKQIINEKAYLTTLRKFIEHYGLMATVPIYQSAFGQYIFFGFDKFNWSITYYVSTKPEEGYQKYLELKRIGITNRTMRLAAKNPYLAISVVEPYGNMLYKMPASGYRDFLKDFLNTYFPKSFNEPLTTEKFYDGFYLKKNQQRK